MAADILETAFEQQEKFLEAMRAVRKEEDFSCTGFPQECGNDGCGEITSGAFCSKECQDDWQKRKDADKRNGGNDRQF